MAKDNYYVNKYLEELKLNEQSLEQATKDVSSVDNKFLFAQLSLVAFQILNGIRFSSTGAEVATSFISVIGLIKSYSDIFSSYRSIRGKAEKLGEVEAIQDNLKEKQVSPEGVLIEVIGNKENNEEKLKELSDRLDLLVTKIRKLDKYQMTAICGPLSIVSITTIGRAISEGLANTGGMIVGSLITSVLLGLYSLNIYGFYKEKSLSREYGYKTKLEQQLEEENEELLKLKR